ncbi:hypothetical protein BKA70DRAFT_1217842 [Coprinopsis sp. MPI-PUGE-AT-0042]|nr:hypothetical protein BKA70DRAFT_1217842 [Coprinopsis sp. MPI-PUGE-AT-0042]
MAVEEFLGLSLIASNETVITLGNEDCRGVLYETVCGYLAGKRVLLVGPETTYHLHNLWLDHVEGYREHSCPGMQYCFYHHICLGDQAPPALPVPRGVKQKIPSPNALQDSGSAALQYALSSSLATERDRRSRVYTRPVVDANTGVRIHNYFWLQKARKADIIVLSRAPIPSHARSYTNRELIEPNERMAVQAALGAFLDLFLPAVLSTLEAISDDPDIVHKNLLWHGHWSMNARCTNWGLPLSVPRLRQFWSPDLALVDPWTFHYNAQIYIQNRILPFVLGQYNVAYLPIEGRPSNRIKPSELKGKRKDCIRNPEYDLEIVFFEGLARILKERTTT